MASSVRLRIRVHGSKGGGGLKRLFMSMSVFAIMKERERVCGFGVL